MACVKRSEGNEMLSVTRRDDMQLTRCKPIAKERLRDYYIDGNNGCVNDCKYPEPYLGRFMSVDYFSPYHIGELILSIVT